MTGPGRRLPLEPAALALPAEPFHSPSMLMAARFGVVPYVDHAGLLPELLRWCDGGERFALRLLAGPCGIGKTRAAVQLCQELTGRGWLTGMLAVRHDDDAHGLEALARAATARLVVVDCAETSPQRVSAVVAGLADDAGEGFPVRVVLTVRAPSAEGDLLAPLRGTSAELDAWLPRARVDVLAARPFDSGARRQLFAGAYDAFARLLSLPARPAEIPAELAAPLFSNPLMTVIAAYLGVHGERPAVSAPELLDRLVDDHEDQYWNRIAARPDLRLGIDKTLRRRVVALASLAGANDEAEAVRILGLLDGVPSAVEHQHRLAHWAAQLYRGPRYWNPPEPDLIAQHLVVGAYHEDPAVLDGVLGGRRPADLSQLVGLLARTVVDRPYFTETVRVVLDRQLGYLCDHAVAQASNETGRHRLTTTSSLGSALTDLVKVCPPDPAALPAILDALPPRSDPALRPLSLVLTQQTERYYRRLADADQGAYLASRRGSGAHPGAGLGDSLAHLAIALNNLSVRLADVGLKEKAAAAVREAAGYFRSLAEADPGTYLPDLAIALHNLSLRLADIGELDQAAAAIGEAVGCYRRLAEANPEPYLPNLAIALQNLSLRLTDVGNTQEAATALNQAVGQYRLLVQSNRPVYQPRLAALLSEVSNRLAGIGRGEEARAAVAEAVGHYRDLSDGNQGAYLPKLAASLRDLSVRLADQSRGEEARAAAVEAVTQYRRLAEGDPRAYQADLMAALHNLSRRLDDIGLRKDAAAKRAEAESLRHPQPHRASRRSR